MITSLLLAITITGCGNDGSQGDDGPAPDAPSVVPPANGDPLQGLPTGATQWAAVCAKHYGDMISAKFCAGNAPPVLTSLVDLETLLGLAVQPNPNNDPNINANVRVTFNGESEGLGLRQVTSLTPRAFLATPALLGGGPNPTYQVMSFGRGEPFVELVANDPSAQTLRFFLVRFHPACEPNCTYADLQTPTIESGWTGYTLYDDVTIKNTTVDCMTCHQPAGPATRKILRMQELTNPWSHWFYIERPQNKAMEDDFHAAHGQESYAGIPASLVDPSRPFALQGIVAQNGFGTQPNAFVSTTIEAEMTANGSSSTWASLYAKSVAGQEIPAPYFTMPQTDPTKVQAMISAYQQTMAGTLPRDQMPDVSDTILPAALPFMSITPKAGLDGRGILTHMCRMCHNSQLDQTQTRATFNIDTLDQLPKSVKDLAIARLMLPEGDALHMPPARFHTLSDAERQLAIDLLSQ